MKDNVKTVVATAAAPSCSKRRKKADPARHRWFDDWMVVKGERLRSLVNSILALVAEREPAHTPRIRQRSEAERKKHERAIEGVVANLAYAVLNPPSLGRIAIDTRHGERGRTRYDSPAFGKRFKSLIYVLWQEDVLDYQHSPGRGEKTSIAPSSWFARKVREAGVTLADFARDPEEELVLLSRNSRNDTGPPTDRKRKERLDYDDNDTTRSYREALRRLNSFLADADVTFIDDGLEPRVDPFDRTLTRRFLLLEGQSEPRFDQGGRLFGGFWQTISSARRKQIRINGEPVADLDYASMFTRLAYAELDATVPDREDLYDVPGLTGYRSGVKLAMNCFLFDPTAHRKRWPKQMGVGVEADAEAPAYGPYEALLPAGWTIGKTKKAILAVHPTLKEAWGRALGYRLMWRESEVLLAVLLELMRRGVPALPMHDGLLVAASKAQVASEVMREQSRAVVGAELPVTRKA